MKQRGYKEVRYWVPDTGSAAFGARIKSEMRALRRADADDGTADFLDEIQSDVLNDDDR